MMDSYVIDEWWIDDWWVMDRWLMNDGLMIDEWWIDDWWVMDAFKCDGLIYDLCLYFCTTPQVLSPSHVSMKVWERGAGPTLACGTGACAVVVAGTMIMIRTHHSLLRSDIIITHHSVLYCNEDITYSINAGVLTKRTERNCKVTLPGKMSMYLGMYRIIDDIMSIAC